MELKEVQNKEEWEGFLQKCEEKTFLQSWNWGEFQKLQGNNIWRFGVYDNNALVFAALVIKIKARRGTFLFVPHLVEISKSGFRNPKQILSFLISKLEKLGEEERADFVRICPLWKNNEENREKFKELGFRESPMHASAYEATWKLGISFPEEELLKNMRKTTRYLIKKAGENADIKIERAGAEGIESYQKLNKEVAKRQNFMPFSDKFIKDEFDVFAKDGQAEFIFGKYKGEVAAGAMIIFWNNVAFYHQAASLGKFAKHSIPYLLQWEAIREAKMRGCEFYDFWGFTDPKKYPKHPWAGPTLFKMGFGGFSTEYVKTQDFVLSQKYWINYIIEKIRKFKRGL